MLRWILLAVLVVGLTVAASFVAHYLPARTTNQDTTGGGPAFPHLDGKEAPKTPGKATILSGGELVYDFGTMSTQAVGNHEWVIKNEGAGDLLLKQGHASCSCTIAGLAQGETATVKPGEETTVKLKWETRTHTGPYGQRAEVLVMNDPDRQSYDFTVRGTVSPALVTVPPDSIEDFTDVSDGKSHSVFFAIFSPDRPSTQITGLDTSRPERIVASYKPLTADERDKTGAKDGGYKVEVEFKPGMPLGELHEAVVIRTDHPNQESLRMLINGHTVGPISTTPDRLTISRVSSSQGASRMLTIWVRGQEQTKFDVAKVPDHLQVSVSPVEDKSASTNSDAHARRYRLEVKVMPGTPSGLIDGAILLKTDHPQAGEIRIPVNVTVTSAG